MGETIRRPRKRRCQNCGNMVPVKSFSTNEKTLKRLIPVSPYCLVCRTANPGIGRNLVPWTWADAILKHTSQAVGRVSGAGSMSQGITSTVVAALMELQHYRCALTGVQLLLPEAGTVLTHGTTLVGWSAGRPDAGNIPVLAKVRESGDWMPGNVVLIAQFMRDVVQHLGGAAELCRAVDHSRDGVDVYTPQAITMEIARAKGKQ